MRFHHLGIAQSFGLAYVLHASLLHCQLMGVERPNILWISCEDMSSNLACYGDPDAITPNLDSLAERGVRYSHAFTVTGVCATNRSSIITGMYPTSIGTQHMRCRATLPSWLECFTVYLRRAGYYCTNNAKTDYNFSVEDDVWDESSRQAHWRGRQPNQPFFHVRNFTNTHESKNWPRGRNHDRLTNRLTEAQRQDPAQVTLPPYYVDNKESRRDWANYLENVTQLDYHVADLLDELEREGLSDDTIVFFWADHGVGLPRAKRWIYDSGTRVPLIVVIPERFRIPGQCEPGTTSDELVSLVDLGPTVLNLAGVGVPSHMQGRAFLGNDLPPRRNYVHSVRDRMDERYDLIRSVRGRRYRYIRNYMPWKPYSQFLNTAERNQTMQALRQAHATGDLPHAAHLFMAAAKPIEELYHSELDPHELRNLVDSADAEHQEALQELRLSHRQWIDETRDLGFFPEPELQRLQDKYGSRYAILRDQKMMLDYSLVRRSLDDPIAVSQLLVWLESEIPTVRYWAAVRLGNRDEQARIHDEALFKAMKDDVSTVRIAAAQALANIGHADRALRVLATELTSDNPWTRLLAVTALDELDAKALPVLQSLRSAMVNQPNKYIVRVAARALTELGYETSAP